MTLIATIEVLLKGGFITCAENKLGTKRKYTVHKPNPYIKGTGIKVGTITEKTVNTLMRTAFIKPTHKMITDKHGSKLWWYESNIRQIDEEE